MTKLLQQLPLNNLQLQLLLMPLVVQRNLPLRQQMNLLLLTRLLQMLPLLQLLLLMMMLPLMPQLLMLPLLPQQRKLRMLPMPSQLMRWRKLGLLVRLEGLMRPVLLL